MLKITVLLLSLLVSVTALAAQSGQVWEHSAPRGIKHFEMTPAGDVFISTDRESYVLDGQTGAVVWTLTDLRDCEHRQRMGFRTVTWVLSCNYLGKDKTDFTILQGTPYGVVRPENRIAVVEMRTGEILLDSEARALGKILENIYVPEMNAFFLHVDAGGARDVVVAFAGDSIRLWRTELGITKSPRWFPLQDGRFGLVYGKDAQNRRVVASLDMQEQTVQWMKLDIAQKDIDDDWMSYAVRDSAGEWLLYLTDPGPLRVDATGMVRWRSTAFRGRPPMFTLYDGSRLYVQANNEVIAIDAANGEIAWEHRARAKPLSGIVDSPTGIILTSPAALDAVAHETGRPLWNAPTSLPPQSPRAIDSQRFYAAASDHLNTIRLDDGSSTRSSPFTLEFRESPQSLELTSDGVLIASRQNLLSVDSQGNVRYQAAYPPVRESGFLVALRKPLALGVALAAGLHNLTNTNPMLPMVAGPVLPHDYFGRYPNIRAGDDRFRFIHTNEPIGDTAGYSLVRIDKFSGAVTGHIIFGERNPNLYIGPPDNSRPKWEGVRKTNIFVHSATQSVFLKESARVVKGFRFQTLPSGN